MSERSNQDWIVTKTSESFGSNKSVAVWKNFHLEHKDMIKSVVTGINGALNDVQNTTDGFVVDLTPPLLHHLADGPIDGLDISYQVCYSFKTRN